jgi:hypothetical protein
MALPALQNPYFGGHEPSLQDPAFLTGKFYRGVAAVRKISDQARKPRNSGSSSDFKKSTSARWAVDG